MKKLVKIEGIDCANCAKVLENEINKIPSVKNAKINFVKSSLSFESNNVEESLKEIITLTKQIEPDAKIIEAQALSMNKQKLIIDICTLAAGAIIGVLTTIFKNSLPIWLFWLLYVTGALILGFKTYYKAITLLFRGIVNENLLITISVIGSAAIGEELDALMVVMLYSIGKILEGIAVNKSRKSIEKLTNLQPDYAVVLNNGKETKVLPAEVKEGSIIIVRPGEKVPVDGIIVEGKTLADLKSLTGENIPYLKNTKDTILSGTIVLDGVIKIKTTSSYSECTVSKIMNMIENASEKKSKTETFISKFTRWYTLIVIACSILTCGIAWIITKNFNDSLYKSLNFLVISCPCAFAISVPLAYFSGIGNASHHGILIKGSNYLDACSKIKKVGFDKTGTLTNGKFNILSIISKDKNYSEKDILYISAIGEQYSNHPLAKAIVHANKKKLSKATNIREISGKGIYFTYQNNNYFVGRKNNKKHNTIIELYLGNKKIGEIHLVDDLKETSTKACQELTKMGIGTVLLSGDNRESVEKVATLACVKEYHYELLPNAKFEWVEEQTRNNKEKLAFVGDGINDAPSLMRADVGIAMGIAGADATIEASDIVIVNDDPYKVSTAIKISKYTRKIVWENIIFALSIKLIALILSINGITNIAFSVFADVGVTLLAILNSIRALKYNPNKEKKNKNMLKK